MSRLVDPASTELQQSRLELDKVCAQGYRLWVFNADLLLVKLEIRAS